ncbi:unnamed protein product [Effrenium voratum]|uniref:tRNA(Ile)-lysidine/2-thiocytidine synthase N-terminal domain-containing protein n=1 Tax=Effrenium voratum TaxID=2562239 RepID=A0AA36MYH9_9DINO|nr:unnamed protein product [Effrenium voratum]
MAEAADLLSAVQRFHRLWFPDAAQPDAVQGFWFGAKRPRDRKLFRSLHDQFYEPLQRAEQLFQERAEVLLTLPVGSQLLVAIFLDQQCRNERALRPPDAEQIEAMITSCSAFARQLAERVMSCAGSADIQLATGASRAQLCFFTLVLRHTRRLPDVRAAQRLLESLAPCEVVTAFRRHNGAVLQQLESQAYVEKALRSHRPRKAVAPACAPCDRQCLAPMCREGMADGLAWQDSWPSLAAHPLCLELKQSLEQRSLADPSCHLVLSYSGGVDSTAHLLLLLALKRQSRQFPNVSCLLLCYPNREAEEVEAEKMWAAWVCQQLEADLFMYEVCLARPHAENGEEVGVTREEYERWTKEIRFRMYRCLLEDCPGRSAVILGHHQDDVDENRLDHLMKGHVLGDVEGMWAWREIHGVQLFRPLLHRRKVDFTRLLEAYPTPHFRDSTPAWSVRGATRRALDGLRPAEGAELSELLGSCGRLSKEVGQEVDSSIALWAQHHVGNLQLPKGATGVAIRLRELFQLQVGARLAEVKRLISRIRELWNPLAEAPAICAIPEALPDIEGLLFEKAFFAAAGGTQGSENLLDTRRAGHYHSSSGCSVNRRAVRHLYENIKASQKPQFSGGLTQELGYLYVSDSEVLVLYDASSHPDADFKTMRSSIVAAVAAWAEKGATVARTEVCGPFGWEEHKGIP